MILVLADTVIRGEDLDAQAAEQARNQALQGVQQKQNSDGDFDYSLAKTSLAESLAQLRTIKRLKKLNR